MISSEDMTLGSNSTSKANLRQEDCPKLYFKKLAAKPKNSIMASGICKGVKSLISYQ